MSEALVKLVPRAILVLMPLALVLVAGTGSTPRVLNGIDVLREQNFRPLSGKRVGLITNHTGLAAADGARTIELLHKSGVCKLAAIFSPEHGVGGTLDSKFNSSRDEATSAPVYSLYGETTHPTAEMLQNIDALVFDIQDIGARFYTYITTMGYCMEAAAKANIPFYVLDRPNPIGGQVEGPMLDPDRTSFTGYMPLPVRHGMTVGELARYFNAEKKIGAQLHVVEMKGWSRSQFFWDTGQLWVNPSPNMRTITAAILYPGVCLLEQTNVSVGRGTDRPFEILGAPWIEPRHFAAELGKEKPPGVEAIPVFFTPDSGKHRGARCGGLSLTIVDPEKLNSVLLGLSLISVLHRLYPDQFEIDRVLEILGSAEALRKLKAGETPADVLRADRARVREFLVRRKAALIY